MKHKNKQYKNQVPKLGGGSSLVILSVMLALMLSISACSDNSLLPGFQKQSQKQQKVVNKKSRKSVINLTYAGLSHSKRLSQWVKKVATKDGPAIIKALKKKPASFKKWQTPFVTLSSLKKVALPKVASSKAGNGYAVETTESLADVGSVLHIRRADGKIEKFVMTLIPIGTVTEHPDPKAVQAVVSRMNAGKAVGTKSGATYLALNPNFFYVHENAQGESNWPVTFPAVSMNKPHKTVSVTGYQNANGVVRYKIKGSGSSRMQPNLVFVTPTPVVHPNIYQKKCKLPGPPKCPAGPPIHYPPPPPPPPTAPCSSIHSHGSNVGFGETSPGDTYFDLYKLHLWKNGQGGNGNAPYVEMQMITAQNDDYNQCLPQKPWYNFNMRVTFRYTDNDGNWQSVYSTANYGADGKLYATRAVQFEGQTYSFLHRPIVKAEIRYPYPLEHPGYYIYKYVPIGYSMGGFPLFNLTEEPGPWRLVLSENDRSYDDFSVHEGNNHLQGGIYVEDIHTFNMSTGTWSDKSTGFTPYIFNHGNSDDPLVASGVRQITIPNVQGLATTISGIPGQAVRARKSYQGRGQYFKYVFGLTER